jgi:hypothetical protein
MKTRLVWLWITLVIFNIGCPRAFFTANVKVDVDEKSTQSAKTIFFFVKDEKKFDELKSKNISELNVYSDPQLVSQDLPRDLTVTETGQKNIPSQRVVYNTKDSQITVVIYTFSYKDTGVKNINFRFYRDDNYLWGLICYWSGIPEHNKKEVVPANISGVNINCDYATGAKFEFWK